MAAQNGDGASRPLGGGGRRGAALAFAGWWVASALLWLSLVDNTHLHELIVGAVVAFLGAGAAVLVRSQRRLVLRPRVRWLLAWWRPLAAYPLDCLLVTLALVRAVLPGPRPKGRLIAIPFDSGEEDPREAARRVLMKTAGSFAPNTYVVGADEERGLLLVHQLVRRPDPAADADPLGLR